MSKKKIIIIGVAVAVVLAIIIGIVVATSGKKGGSSSNTSKKESVKPGEDGASVSYLTGLWVKEEDAKKRPVAIMTENTKSALPQYGINSASVIYEAPVEGGITRMMSVFENLDDLALDQIGNVRSCRPYYAYFAAELDAIYVHFGQSIHAEVLLNQGGVDNLNGLDGSVSNDVFYRTKEHDAPHNAYTSSEGVKKGIEKKEYRTEYSDSFKPVFSFASQDKLNELKDGKDCVTIKPYYFYNQPKFVYDAKTKTYKRYQFDAEQIDKIDGKQTEVTNIIFRNVDSSLYEETQYLNLKLSGKGDGKFFTNGKMIDITWDNTQDGFTRYYDKSGNEIKLNPGRTWICIIETEYADKCEFSAKEE